MCALSTSLSRLSKAISLTENILTILYTVIQKLRTYIRVTPRPNRLLIKVNEPTLLTSKY